VDVRGNAERKLPDGGMGLSVSAITRGYAGVSAPGTRKSCGDLGLGLHRVTTATAPRSQYLRFAGSNY
jgi:hypothetical protein